MSLTLQQELNTAAPVFDVEYRWFAGPAYAVVAATGVRAVFAAWTAPDTSKPATWTEITTKVSFAGRFQRTWSGAVLDWTLDVRGTNFDATLLAEGNAIACWQRIHRPTGTEAAPAGWQAWELRCVGMLSKHQDRDNYQHGHAWQATIVSHSRLLGSINAPRLTAGKIRITEGATVTGSDELAQTAYEVDQGEFTGGSAEDVGPEQVVDGNRNTLYISSATPTATRPAEPPPFEVPQLVEIMLTPLAGWSAASTWWVDFIGGKDGFWFLLGSYDNGVYAYKEVRADWTLDAPFKEYSVLCANRRIFDQYTGGGNAGAAQIFDVSEYTDLPANWLNDGMIRVMSHGIYGGSAMAWAPGGASRTYELDGENFHEQLFSGPTLNTNNFVAGQSWTAYPPSQNPANWALNANPHPGANSLGVEAVWLKVELPENICNTLDVVSASSTTIRLNNYRAWLVPSGAASAQGIIANNVFTWTSRDANGLHGVTWNDTPAAPIPAGTRCYPYVNSLAQTGYPLTATHLRRRKQPAISHYKVYWSAYGDVRDFTQTGWAADYYPTYHEVQENTQVLRLSDSLGDATYPYTWVRSIMYLIYKMTDGGRAKVNEVEADIAQLALDLAGLPDLDGSESWNLARWLFVDWADLAAADFTADAGVSGHRMGSHALAITPVSQVLGSLARVTGCLVSYDTGGGVTWLPDPWWPYKTTASELLYWFEAASVRGDVSTALNTLDVDYVILNALSLEDDEPHTVRYVYPQPWGTSEPPVAALVTEINDVVLAHDADAPLVAKRELERLQLGARTATLTVKGVGEWCAPSNRVELDWDLDNDGTVESTMWLIQQVATTTEQRGGAKSLRTELQLQRFKK